MKSVKLGISTYCYPYAIGVPGFLPQKRMNAFELVDHAIRLGVSIVQIADNYPLHLLSWSELSRLYEYAFHKGITLEVGTRGIQTEHLEEYLQIARILHAKLLRVVIDTKDHTPDYDEIILLLKRVIPSFEKEGVVLGIENHDRFKCQVFAKMMEAIRSHSLGIVLDTVNSFSCEENTQQVMDQLAKYTVNFHVKDFEIRRVPNSMGLKITGTVSGRGFLKIPEMVQKLKCVAQSDFSVILEQWMDPEPEIGQTLKKEERWVEESIKYLKSIL